MRTPSPQNKQNLLLTSTQYTNQLILNKIKATEFFHYSPFTSTQPQLFKEGSPIFIRDTHSCCFLWEKPNMRIYPDIFGCLSKYQLAKWAKQYEHPTLIFYFYFIFPGSSSKWRKRSLVLKTWSITKIGSWRLCHRWVGAKKIPNFRYRVPQKKLSLVNVGHGKYYCWQWEIHIELLQIQVKCQAFLLRQVNVRVRYVWWMICALMVQSSRLRKSN